MATKAKPKVKLAPVAAKGTQPVDVKKAVRSIKSSPEVKAPVKRNTRPKVTSGVTVEQRRNYVEVAAFFIAERRGFVPGDLMADWLAAETQVDLLIAEGKIGS